MKNLRSLAIISCLLLISGTGISLEWKSVGPTPRRSSTMIVDSLNRRTVLFGGTSYRLNGRWYNDIWEMELSNPDRYAWFQIPVSGTQPSPRCNHSAVYDPEHQRMLIFGGDAGGTLTNDVWSLNLVLGQERWERLNPSGTPPQPRSSQYAIYHPTRNSLIIFGGDLGNYQWVNDVWELKLDSMVWREIVIPGERPAPRGAGGAFFDQVNNRMIIFGGGAWDNYYNDVWALDLTPGNEHWTQLNPSGSIPIERSNFAYGFNPRNSKFYIFGGINWPLGLWFNDTYVLDLPTLNWTELRPTGELPIERRNSVGVFDFFNDNFFIFGGDLGWDYYLGETYFLNVRAIDISEWNPQPAINISPSLSVSLIGSGSVSIRYTLPKTSEIGIKILDVSGRVVKNLFSGKATPPGGRLFWDGRSESGQVVSSGSYFCLLETENTRITEKFLYTK